MAVRRLGGPTVLFLALAAVWVVAQFVFSFSVHLTARGHETASGWVVPPRQTTMAADGVSDVVLTVVVLALVLTVAASLQRRAAHGAAGAGALSWGISALTVVLGVFGFGFLWVVGVWLLLACTTVPRRAPERGERRAPTAPAAGTG